MEMHSGKLVLIIQKRHITSIAGHLQVGNINCSGYVDQVLDHAFYP